MLLLLCGTIQPRTTLIFQAAMFCGQFLKASLGGNQLSVYSFDLLLVPGLRLARTQALLPECLHLGP